MARELEAFDGFDETDGANLQDIFELPVPQRAISPGRIAHQVHVCLDERVAGVLECGCSLLQVGELFEEQSADFPRAIRS
nr:hypothetical protein [Streptomyces griseus]